MEGRDGYWLVRWDSMNETIEMTQLEGLVLEASHSYGTQVGWSMVCYPTVVTKVKGVKQ